MLIGSSLLFSVMAVCVRIAGREMPALHIAFVCLTCATGVFTAAGLEAIVLGEHLPLTSFLGAVLMCLAVGFAARRG